MGQEGAMTADEKVTLFHTLRDQAAVEPRRAAHAAQHYGPQLRDLLGMGFGGARLERAIDLLGRYGGRLTRVVNALSEEHAAAAAVAAGGSSSSGGAAAAAAPPPRAAAAASATEAATAVAVTKSRQQEAVRAAFQLAFAQLVSAGVPPKEAAAQALIKAGQTASAEAAAAPMPAATAAPAPPTAGLAPAAAAAAAPPVAGAAQWQDELGQLEGMGFGNEQRNVELLNRYNGRMLRVINALAEGPPG